MAHVREQDERRSSDCSGARVNDRSANVGSFLEQRREEPESFDKWGSPRISCYEEHIEGVIDELGSLTASVELKELERVL
jgi:hypothetical protein